MRSYSIFHREYQCRLTIRHPLNLTKAPKSISGNHKSIKCMCMSLGNVNYIEVFINWNRHETLLLYIEIHRSGGNWNPNWKRNRNRNPSFRLIELVMLCGISPRFGLMNQRTSKWSGLEVDAAVIRQSHITIIGNTIGSISIYIYEEDLCDAWFYKFL